MDAKTLVIQTFPGVGFVKLHDAAKFIGMAYKTARNRLWEGSFPLPTVKIGKNRMVPIGDLIQFVEQNGGV